MLSFVRTLNKREGGHLLLQKRFYNEELRSDHKRLKTDVINLYKSLIYLSRDWHTDLRPKIKDAFLKNKDEKNPEQIRQLIDRGEYICRELTATYYLKKYRTLKRRYYKEAEGDQVDEIIKKFNS